MRMIGLIGGISWKSSAEYYRLLNEGVRDRCNATTSARCLLWSFDFEQISTMQHRGEWDELTVMMVDAAQRLEGAGADMLVICANTMHRMAPEIEAATHIPLLHIADPTARRIKRDGHSKVGLLGTSYTMEHDFYKGRLADVHGLEVIVPDEADRALVHRVIFDELVAGIVSEESRQTYRAVIARLVEQGAEAIILGCTELMLLVRDEDSAVPLYDTTALHVEAAVEAVLAR